MLVLDYDRCRDYGRTEYWDVFDPVHPQFCATVPRRWQARLIVWLFNRWSF